MKKAKRLLLGTVLIGFFLSAPAQAFDLYGFGSYWDKKDADSTWGAGLGVSLPILTEFLRLDGRAYFFEEGDFRGGDNLDLTPIDVGVQIHLMPDTELDPYLLGGISFIYADAKHLDVDSGYGGYLGGGVQYGMPDSIVNLFGEIVYRASELDTSWEEDIDVSGFTVNIGLKLHF